MRFEARQMSGELAGYFGIWNPNTRGWVKWNKRDQTPAFFNTRDDAQKMCDKANDKYGR